MARNVSEKKLRVVDDIDGVELGESRLPDEVQLALSDIAEVAREGLLALSVAAGLAVLGEMMEAERTVLCGPRDAKDPRRSYVRGGTTPTSVVLGGRARFRSAGPGWRQRTVQQSRAWRRSRRRARRIC